MALYETVQRFFHPRHLSHLGLLALAGVIGFAGNELTARDRLRAGRRLRSPALVALGLQVADPLIGLGITALILRITWQSWRTVSVGTV